MRCYLNSKTCSYARAKRIPGFAVSGVCPVLKLVLQENQDCHCDAGIPSDGRLIWGYAARATKFDEKQTISTSEGPALHRSHPPKFQNRTATYA
eukprot:2315335-Amphidinium_carterae.1